MDGSKITSDDQAACPLTLNCFGGLEVRVDGMALPKMRSRKEGWLLVLLALAQETEVHRARLTQTLWPFPDYAEDQANFYLRRSLTNLRHGLGAQAWRIESPTSRSLRLDLSGCACDFIAFDTNIQKGDPQSLESAVNLYRGPFLGGCTEIWAQNEQTKREAAYLGAIEALARFHLARGANTIAMPLVKRAAEMAPLREGAHRLLMEAYAAAGENAQALLVYQDLRLRLRREANCEPDPETTALYQTLRRPSAPIVPACRADAPDQIEIAPNVPEWAGGAVPLDSPFYVLRPTDEAFHEAIEQRASVVLVKGARQMGKTSLLARGLHEARAREASVALTDFQTMGLPILADSNKLLLALAASLVDQLGLEAEPSKVWNPDLGANANFDRFMGRHVLAKLEGHLVWGLDEIDRLFPPACSFGTEIFALLRSWHNRRSLDPHGRWSQLTLAIAYATEAHLFIDDINQSPFNVGVRLSLDDFDLRQISDLNSRYGRPLDDSGAVRRFHALSGGHPYLVRRGLDEMCRRKLTIDEVEKEADRDEGCFGDHLRRLQATLSHDHELADAVRSLVRGQPGLTSRSFYRLRSAGVVSGGSVADAQFRCRLYSAYLARNLDDASG